LTLDTAAKKFNAGNIGLSMIFTVSELLNIENTKGHAAFVSFLCDIQDMNEYGMPYSIEMSSD
jgi:hypothetical protein